MHDNVSSSSQDGDVEVPLALAVFAAMFAQSRNKEKKKTLNMCKTYRNRAHLGRHLLVV